MKRLIRDVIAAAAVSTLALSGYAHALDTPPAPRCLPHAQMVELLQERWDEERVTVALRSDGRLVELYASPGGSWTSVATTPQGYACMVAAGEGFRIVQVPGHDA